MDLRVIVKIHTLGRNVYVIFDTAAAHRGGATIGVHVKRRCHIAYHRVGLMDHGIQGIVIVGTADGHSGSQNLFIGVVGIHQTFAGVFRYSATPKFYLVHTLRDRIEAIYSFLLSAVSRNHIQVGNTLSIHHTIQPRDRLHRAVCPAIIAHQAQIEHILIVHKTLACGHHVRLGHQ